MKIYLVGGAVRDELLGLEITERDWVVVGATPQQMIDQGYIPVGKSFPVFLHPQTKEEYALARTERKIAGGYHGFEFNTSQNVTVEEDLRRRDLTINAMAKSEQGEIIDPYGGQKDLKNKILRHVSEAFTEDPVRVLRIARFSARYSDYTIAPETLALMQKMVENKECDYLVPERVWKEMERALREDTPQRFIQVLKKANALKVILPEIDKLYGVPQDKNSHPEVDTGKHIELVLEQAARLSPEPQVRFAALVHDVGKGLTDPQDWPKHPSHEIKGEPVVKALCERLRVPKDFQQLAQIVTRYHGENYDAQENGPQAFLRLLEKCDAFRRPERFEQFLLACEADFRGRPGFEDQTFIAGTVARKAWEAARVINIQAVIDSQQTTLPPNEIKKAIFEARLKAITQKVKE